MNPCILTVTIVKADTRWLDLLKTDTSLKSARIGPENVLPKNSALCRRRRNTALKFEISQYLMKFHVYFKKKIA